ncbi:MAG TPA: hypothetical protein VM869_06455 [Enhygromyxa sp.]|nr:hypothetical protein [Enhygromyxa sp.]
MPLDARCLLCSFVSLLGCATDPPADETADASETDGDGDGDGDGEGDGDGDGDGAPHECAPPNPVTARFTVTPPEPRTATCALQSETSDGLDAYSMTLDCEGVIVTVTLDSTILIMPNPGEMVALDYRTEMTGPIEQRWLAIHQVENQQALVLGAVSAMDLAPPGTTSGEFFRDPSLAIVPELVCESMTDACGDWQRLELMVALEQFGPSGSVFDHGSWYANYLAFGYAIEVEEALRRAPVSSCDDVPLFWFQLLVTWFPSD